MANRWNPSTIQAAVASLPMYGLPELREAHSRLWGAIHERLLAGGLVRASVPLLDGGAGEEAWTDPRVLLTQVCGYPWALGRRSQVQLLATPAYRARGCQGPYHRSAVLVRRRDRAMVLADVHGYRVAINAPDSNTGVNLLRAAVAPLAGRRPFFSGVTETGAHARSLSAVIEGLADLAAVDCVTFALMERFAPDVCRGLRVLAWTGSSPGLPLVTSVLTSHGERTLLRRALQDVAFDLHLRDVRQALLLEGFHDVDEGQYRDLTRLGADPDGRPCPALA